MVAIIKKRDTERIIKIVEFDVKDEDLKSFLNNAQSFRYANTTVEFFNGTVKKYNE